MIFADLDFEREDIRRGRGGGFEKLGNMAGVLEKQGIQYFFSFLVAGIKGLRWRGI